MMKFVFLSIMTFGTFSVFAQKTDPEERLVRQEIGKEVQRLVADFESELTEMAIYSETDKAFMIDTFRIERRTDLMMEHPYFSSTMGMGIAMTERYNDYDALLNKYYKLLMAQLNKADQVQLQTAQRAWVDFRDKNRSLIMTLSEERNSGGGTMQRLITNGRDARVLIERVSDLADYYSQIVNK